MKLGNVLDDALLKDCGTFKMDSISRSVLRNWSMYLFDCGVIKEEPFGGLGVESEGAVVFACVADHPNQLQVTLLGLFICDMVKNLEREKMRWGLRGGGEDKEITSAMRLL